MSFQLLVNYLFVSYFVKNSHSNLRFVKLKPKYRHYHPHWKLFQKHLPPLAVPLDVLRKGLCFMYLQIFIVIGEMENYFFVAHLNSSDPPM